ncbi:MAG: hypothetical protein FWE47_04610 [Oscillospiraceae bacterium]|nr:hypothetical protein [Oscillospiraceae bacterium]
MSKVKNLLMAAVGSTIMFGIAPELKAQEQQERTSTHQILQKARDYKQMFYDEWEKSHMVEATGITLDEVRKAIGDESFAPTEKDYSDARREMIEALFQSETRRHGLFPKGEVAFIEDIIYESNKTYPSSSRQRSLYRALFIKGLSSFTAKESINLYKNSRRYFDLTNITFGSNVHKKIKERANQREREKEGEYREIWKGDYQIIPFETHVNFYNFFADEENLANEYILNAFESFYYGKGSTEYYQEAQKAHNFRELMCKRSREEVEIAHYFEKLMSINYKKLPGLKSSVKTDQLQEQFDISSKHLERFCLTHNIRQAMGNDAISRYENEEAFIILMDDVLKQAKTEEEIGKATGAIEWYYFSYPLTKGTKYSIAAQTDSVLDERGINKAKDFLMKEVYNVSEKISELYEKEAQKLARQRLIDEQSNGAIKSTYDSAPSQDAWRGYQQSPSMPYTGEGKSIDDWIRDRNKTELDRMLEK